jgi:hypothetical protein
MPQRFSPHSVEHLKKCVGFVISRTVSGGGSDVAKTQQKIMLETSFYE